MVQLHATFAQDSPERKSSDAEMLVANRVHSAAAGAYVAGVRALV